MRKSEASQFLNGLHQPNPEAVRKTLPGLETTVLTNQTDPLVVTAPVDPHEGESARTSDTPYSALIDRLNALWPTDCHLTEEGSRLLDAMFERVCEAQRRSDPLGIQAAVNAVERATRQLILEQGTPALNELLL